MKINKGNQYLGVIFFSIFFAVLAGCAKLDTSTGDHYDKPESLIEQDSLNAFNPLKSYIDYSNQANFNLGAELSLSDVQNNSLLYRLAQKHFDEIDYTNLKSTDYVQADGSILLDNFQNFVKADSAGIPLFVGPLVTHQNQQATYLNGLIADSIIPGESGNFTVADFENNSVGDTYPVMGAGTATVAPDPDGKSGNTLNIVGPQTFPQFQVTLTDGLTLGNCKSVTIDFRGPGSGGLYGQGMRMAITTALGTISFGSANSYSSPSGFGAGDGSWARGLIILPIAQLGLTDAQKSLTSFVLTVGSATGSANYLMDNVTIQWGKVGQTIVKTPEQKAEIIQGELEKWIKGVAEAGKGKVHSWSVIYQPMDDSNPSELRTGIGNTNIPANTFYWQDYLGKDYASIAINMLKQYGDASDKMFFTETNLMANPAKIQGLDDFIKYTESKGSKVDGIATELALDITSDTAAIDAMLSQLAATGKLIKISSLDIGIGVSINQATDALYEQQAEMYKWFVQTYYKLIPASQRAGITFRSPLDQSSSSSWRPNEPVGLWTGQNVRKAAYGGVVEALKSESDH